MAHPHIGEIGALNNESNRMLPVEVAAVNFSKSKGCAAD
jgi:hypothetical protein